MGCLCCVGCSYCRSTLAHGGSFCLLARSQIALVSLIYSNRTIQLISSFSFNSVYLNSNKQGRIPEQVLQGWGLPIRSIVIWKDLGRGWENRLKHIQYLQSLALPSKAYCPLKGLNGYIFAIFRKVHSFVYIYSIYMVFRIQSIKSSFSINN